MIFGRLGWVGRSRRKGEKEGEKNEITCDTPFEERILDGEVEDQREERKKRVSSKGFFFLKKREE